MQLVANDRASVRTRNRVTEHAGPGHSLTTGRWEPSVMCLDGKAGHLYRCECGWAGWLADNELACAVPSLAPVT